MDLKIKSFTVHKRYALKISRQTTSESTNICLIIQEEGIFGYGEASPFSIGSKYTQTTESILAQFDLIIPQLEKFSPWQQQEIESFLAMADVSFSVRAAVDMALHDWLGKRVNLPLWQLWGLNLERIVPTSLTIGINSPEGAKERVFSWQNLVDCNFFKVKLGNPAGIDADRAMFLAVKEAASNASLTVDANGGWSLEDAITMCDWLADFNVLYVEQPFPPDENHLLLSLKERSSMAIFADESCFSSKDIPVLAQYFDGVNIKIMKCGGLKEAKRTIDVAKAFGLKVMFGCYSDSILANTAMSHLAPLADYLDLDSHLNLVDDPFSGSTLEEGRLIPNHLPGLGVVEK